MDHDSSFYYPFNHLQHPLYFNPVSPVHAFPPGGPLGHPEIEKPKDYHYAPASPSDFIYNSSATANPSANANTTASTSTSTNIFDRPSRPSASSSSSSRSLFSISISNEAVLGYPPAGVEYGGGGGGSSTGAVEQSVLDFLPEVPGVLEPSPLEPRLLASSLPQPAPGFEEHRRQRQRQSAMMTMGPGPSKSVPPALSLGGGDDQGNDSRNSSESTVVIKREEEEEGSSSSVPWVSIPLGQRVKRWEPREPRVPQGKQGKQGKQVEGDVGADNGISGSKTWEERGDGVVGRVMPPVVHSMGTNAGVEMVAGMETGMGTGMAPTITPKMGLFKPIRWDGPSSSKAKAKARRIRAWETVEGDCGNVPLQRSLEIQNRHRNRNENGETEDENVSGAPISPHSRSPKRLKTSSHSGGTFRPGAAETKTDAEIKQEPGLSPPPSAIFAQIPMYGSFDSAPSNNSGYESPGRYDNSLSSRSISPLTRVPTPRRVLFTTTTPNLIMTGTTRETTQPSLRAVSKQLKKRNREMALGQVQGREDYRELSREPRKKRKGEGCWSLPAGNQGQQTHDTSLQQQQQQENRGSSEEREEKGWTTTTISAGSSEEGEVSSHYENENSYSYSCGQQKRDKDDAAAAAAASSNNFLSYTNHQEEEEEWCRSFSFSSSSSSSSAVPVSYETSARYDHVSSASQERRTEEEEGYRQAIIQMVQDTCLEASKRYIRAHCVNRGARDGGGSPDTSPAPRQTVSTRSARKARRRKHKLRSRQASFSSFSSSSSPESSPAQAPSRQRRRRRRQNRTEKQTTTTTPPPSLPSLPHHQPPPPPDIHLKDSLLPNISQICTLLWSRSQSLRLHDTDSIELHTARNMYWLLSWAETVAFAVLPPASFTSTSTSTSTLTAFTVSDPHPNSNPEPDPFDSSTTISVGSSFPGFDGSPSSLRQGKRECEWNWEWEGFGEGVSEEGDKAEGESETINGKAVWEQQRIEEMIKRVLDEGGMLCEFLGYGEGVERLGRVREFYGF